MLPAITEEELEFCECFYNSECMAESLFSDYDNMARFDEEKNAHIRLGQIPLISFEYILDYDSKLSAKENFKFREGAGNIWSLGGRKFGKTLFVEKVDLCIAMLTLDAEECGFTSLDALHIRGILESVVQILENHPLYKVFKPKINRSPNYRFYLNNGFVLESINMNLASKNPGAQFFQKHFKRLYIEEASFETEEIYGKRLESISELGCVYRVAGMTTFTKYSPVGKIFYDLSKKPVICNLPQYINPTWDANEKARAIKEYGGEQTIGYRVFVRGEVVEEGMSVFDMIRVRTNYNEEKKVKFAEINKENFGNFEQILSVIERPRNSSFAYLCADIGESAPTEIVILFQINEKYRYDYNITLYNLSDKEQYKIFKFLALLIGANFIGLDTTEGTGRAIFRSLEDNFSKDNLIWVSFNEKLPVDFEKDEKQKVILEEGKPVIREEYVSEWSVKHLKDLFYENRMELPIDFKLDIQLNSVVSLQSGTRTVYECISEQDHMFAAFRVFSIAQWYNEFRNIRPVIDRRFAKSGV
jgi:hypothetical protein